MNPRILLAAAAAICAFLATPADAMVHQDLQKPVVDVAALPPYPLENAAKVPRGHRQPRHEQTEQATSSWGSGIIRSGKTGATAHVSPSHSAAFQAYIDDLEAGGARVLFMGGYRKGRCWSGGMHPCGLALDVCQLRRGVVDSRCGLPGRAEIAGIAERHGLFEGGRWCNSDYGHAQYGVSAGPCGSQYSARQHHRRTRFAAARQ